MGSKRYKGADDERSDAMFEDILEAIKDRDADIIKGLFSEQALAEAEDIDSAIEYLFNLFDGDIISWERGGMISGGSTTIGKSSYRISVWYTVCTEKGKYEFLLINYKKNADLDMEGLYTLHAIDDADENALRGTWQALEAPGVYKPEE